MAKNFAATQKIHTKTGTSGNSPTKSEVNQEVVLVLSGKGRLDGVVHTEVETTVDDDTNTGAVAVSSGEHFQLRVHPAQVPLVIALSLAAIGVHEFAHALVVVHHGRAVDAAGVRLHLGTPAFYVESASALLLPRRQRLIQAAAGVWAEWQFTSLAALWLWRSPLVFAVPLLHRFVILNAATIATNLAPFTGLDGSWLLADALRAPDLGRRCHGAPARVLLAWAGGQPAAGRTGCLPPTPP